MEKTNYKVNSQYRAEDERKSKVTEKWIDTYCYPLLSKILMAKHNATECYNERVTDKARQVQGIDYIISGVTIDEKAAVHWINKPLNTFMIELAVINRNGEYINGWYTNSTNVTNTYAFLFLDSGNTELETIDDIVEGEVIFVSKSAIQKYLLSRGVDNNVISITTNNIINNPLRIYTQYNQLYTFEEDGFRWYYDYKHVEHSVSLQFCRDKLRELGQTWHYKKGEANNTLISNITNK